MRNEDDLIKIYLDAQATDAYSKPIFAVVLNSDEDSSGLLPKNLSYKIRTIKDLPTNLFKTLDNGPYASPKDYYYMPFAQIQLCLDKSFIDTVAKPDLTFNYDVSKATTYCAIFENTKTFVKLKNIINIVQLSVICTANALSPAHRER